MLVFFFCESCVVSAVQFSVITDIDMIYGGAGNLLRTTGSNSRVNVMRVLVDRQNGNDPLLVFDGDAGHGDY